MVRPPAGLRGRLIILLILAIVPALALLTLERLNRSRLETAELQEAALPFARLAALAQQRRMEGARQLLIALSRSSELQSDGESCTRFLRGLATEYHGIYSEIGWADMSGRVMCHVLPTPSGLSIADRHYFQRAVQAQSFAVGELMYGRVNGSPALAFAHPIRDSSGGMTGVVFANVDLTVLSASLHADSPSPDASVTLLDRQGVILARSIDGARLIGRRVNAEQVQYASDRGELSTVFMGPDAVTRVYGVVAVRDRDGSPAFFVTVGLPRAPLAAAASRRLQFDLLTVAVLGFGLLAAGWVGSDYLIRRPVSRLLDATAALASGRLDVRVREGRGVRELDALGAAFNNMAAQVQQRDLHLRRGQRLEAVGQLAGGIAHDFNNLLTVIIGYGHSLGEHIKPGSEAAHDLSELQTAAARAAKLTQQLLAFSRQQVLQPRPMNVNDVVSGMQSLVTRTIGEDITLAIVAGADLGIVVADAAQLEQVVLNLVINARDAMPGGGTIRIETRNADVTVEDLVRIGERGSMPTGAYVALSIADTGTGMDDDTRARVFEPFFTTKGTRGTGLGLATVYGIVKQSGGFIFCESEPGRGTRFTIYLPRTSERPGTRVEAAVPAPRGGTEAVLVAEDEPGVRTLIATVLAQAGYRVTAVQDGADAAGWMTSGDPVDLLITDVRMPGMNGHSLYEHVRAVKPDVAVLFMSGYAGDDLHTGASIPDEAAFLPKPFTPRTLLAKVRQILDSRK